VQFVIIDLDRKRPRAHKAIVDKYFQGFIPHVVVLNSRGKALYNRPGEVGEDQIAALLEKALQEQGNH